MDIALAFVSSRRRWRRPSPAMLLVRRRAPDGSYFNDGDRAAGVFGVLATGFAVLLGLRRVPGLHAATTTSRDGRRGRGATRGPAVRDGPVLPPAVAGELDRGADLLRPLGRRRRVAAHAGRHARRRRSTRGAWSCSRRCSTSSPTPPTEQSAYDKWLDQTSDREEARRDRVHGAVGVIPTRCGWCCSSAAVIFVYMLFFADSGERAVVQALLMGSVVAVIISMLLLLSPRQPLPRPHRRAPPGRHGTDPRAHRPGPRRAGPERPAALRRPGRSHSHARRAAAGGAPWVEVASAVLLARRLCRRLIGPVLSPPQRRRLIALGLLVPLGDVAQLEEHLLCNSLDACAVLTCGNAGSCAPKIGWSGALARALLRAGFARRRLVRFGEPLFGEGPGGTFRAGIAGDRGDERLGVDPRAAGRG